MQVTIFGWELVFRKRRLRKYHVVYPSTTTGTIATTRWIDCGS